MQNDPPVSTEVRANIQNILIHVLLLAHHQIRREILILYEYYIFLNALWVMHDIDWILSSTYISQIE